MKGYITSAPTTNNPVNIAIEKFRGHRSSIISTKENVFSRVFCFQQTEPNVIQKEINRLNSIKIGTLNNITLKLLT